LWTITDHFHSTHELLMLFQDIKKWQQLLVTSLFIRLGNAPQNKWSPRTYSHAEMIFKTANLHVCTEHAKNQLLVTASLSAFTQELSSRCKEISNDAERDKTKYTTLLMTYTAVDNPSKQQTFTMIWLKSLKRWYKHYWILILQNAKNAETLFLYTLQMSECTLHITLSQFRFQRTLWTCSIHTWPPSALEVNS